VNIVRFVLINRNLPIWPVLVGPVSV
jgi:hypothetical protein